MIVHGHERVGQASIIVEEEEPELAVGRPLEDEPELILKIGVGGENAVAIDISA